MKFVLYNDYRPGLLKGEGVVDISDAVSEVIGRNGQETMEGIITHYDALMPALEQALRTGTETPLSSVQLHAPLPRPGKIVAMGVNYLEFTKAKPDPIWFFLKSSEAVLDPGGTCVLPSQEFRVCHHEAELVAVIGKEGKDIPKDQAMDHVFGYTCGVDVSARGTWGMNPFVGKSYDTFAPMGPCLVTKDEVPDPHNIRVRFWVDGQPRHDYGTDDMAYQIPECVEFASSIMTMHPGDAIFLGTNHQGIGPLQDGETAEMEIEQIGRFSFNVRDPLKRTWPKAVDTEMAAMVKARFESRT